METFHTLFGSLLGFVYHCFDRIVIQGYRIVTRQRSRYTHYYFYIRDEVLGPFVLCVGSFLPFQTTYYLNGPIIAGDLQRRGVRFRTDDNAFLWTANLEALQAAADRLDPATIQQRLEYWTLVLGPKFSKKDRAAVNLRRAYSLNQGVLSEFRLPPPFSDPQDLRAFV